MALSKRNGSARWATSPKPAARSSSSATTLPRCADSPRAIWLDGGQIAHTDPAANVIDPYLQKNTESNLECVWKDDRTAPGNDRLRLHSVRVIPQSSSNVVITVHTPLLIEFTYWNYVLAVLNDSMILNNLEEVYVLSSPSDFKPRSVGLIRHVA